MYYKKPNFKAIDIHKKQLMLPRVYRSKGQFWPP